MKKDTQFTFRIPSDLKNSLEEIALSEGRSVAQICEAFLRAGMESYKKKGFSFSGVFSPAKRETLRNNLQFQRILLETIGRSFIP